MKASTIQSHRTDPGNAIHEERAPVAPEEVDRLRARNLELTCHVTAALHDAANARTVAILSRQLIDRLDATVKDLREQLQLAELSFEGQRVEFAGVLSRETEWRRLAEDGCRDNARMRDELEEAHGEIASLRDRLEEARRNAAGGSALTAALEDEPCDDVADA